MIRILLMGAFPPAMGGDTRHFSTLAADLRVDPRYELTIINTSREREHSRVLRNAILGRRAAPCDHQSQRAGPVATLLATVASLFLTAQLQIADR
jgi:hypothetical protein